MTDAVVTISGGSNSGSLFPSFGATSGAATSGFCTAAGGGLAVIGTIDTSPTPFKCMCIDNATANLVIGVVGSVGRNYFQSVTFTDAGSNPYTFNSSDAVFNGADTSAPGFTTWLFTSPDPDIGPSLVGSDVTFTFHNIDTDVVPSITQATPTVVSATDVILSWTPVAGTGANAGVYESFSVLRNGQVLFDDIDPDVTEWADPT